MLELERNQILVNENGNRGVFVFVRQSVSPFPRRSSPSPKLDKTSVLKSFYKINRNTLGLESLFNKVASLGVFL